MQTCILPSTRHPTAHDSWLHALHFAVSTSTTATVMCLGWCCGLLLRCVRVEDGRDAVPQASSDPEGIACIDRLPGSIGRRHLAPGRPAVHQRKYALELAPQIATGTAPRRRRWHQ